MREPTRYFATLSLACAVGGGLAAQAPAPPASAAEGRIYGRVVTVSGDVLEGYLRWDGNEASWSDVLDGSKELPPEWASQVEELGAATAGGEDPDGGSIELFGLRISWERDDWDNYPRTSTSGIRYGHLRSLTVMDDDEALLRLKTGEEVEFEGGSTDIGEDGAPLVVQDAAGGSVELGWSEIDVVEFLPAPPAASAPPARRLHGTLTDRLGNSYTGYVTWDMDEAFSSDVLDGEEGRREREIAFADIAAIERAGSCCARVTLTSGEVVELDDSNDVDDDNRGIQISDPLLGQVRVEWDAFESLRFHPPEEAASYRSFDGGQRLRGEVVTESGERFSGFIRWDNDERWSWELLDGSHRGVAYEVEFANVSHIARNPGDGVTVTLRDGRVLRLDDSNDVDDGNKGIVVQTDAGGVELVAWRDFQEVLFER